MTGKDAKAHALYLLSETHQKSAPVNLTECASFLKIDIELSHFREKEILGVLIVKQQKPFIVLNQSLTENDKKRLTRFVLAHLIGHFLMHAKGDDVFIEKNQIINCKNFNLLLEDDIREREANRFAAELLAPEYLLAEETKKAQKKPLETFLKDQADLFEVDLYLMTIRLTICNLLEYGIKAKPDNDLTA